MKTKLLALLLTLVMVVGMLASCDLLFPSEEVSPLPRVAPRPVRSFPLLPGASPPTFSTR